MSRDRNMSSTKTITNLGAVEHRGLNAD